MAKPAAAAQEDQRKLHAAINQIDNQRLWLSTIAIAFFGTTVGVAVSRGRLSEQDISSTVLISALTMIVLLALFVYSLFLKWMLRELTTYLVLRNASRWEEDRRHYREHFGTTLEWHERAQAWVFFFLGLVAVAYPGLVWFQNRPIIVSSWWWFLPPAALVAAYFGVVLAFGFSGWLDQETKIEGRWKESFAAARARPKRSSRRRGRAQQNRGAPTRS